MAFSLVMLVKIKEALVIDACCGETHRHTTLKKHKNLITRSTMQAQVPTPCWVRHGLASGRCFVKCFSVQHGRGFLCGVLECSRLSLSCLMASVVFF